MISITFLSIGNFGRVIKLQANYFRLEKMTNWCLYQSRVDFSPNEDRTVVRKKLLRTAMKDILPVYVFDGTVLYASRRLHPDPFEVFVDSEGNCFYLFDLCTMIVSLLFYSGR